MVYDRPKNDCSDTRPEFVHVSGTLTEANYKTAGRKLRSLIDLQPPMARYDFVELPASPEYTLQQIRIPLCFLNEQRSLPQTTSQITSDHRTNAAQSDCQDLTRPNSHEQHRTRAGLPVWSADVDGLVTADVKILLGKIDSINPTGTSEASRICIDMQCSMMFPTFVDLHTHIDKGHTCERSRNDDGSLSGADRSTASDSEQWNVDDLDRRMNFAIASAYAHGTSALRTHLINMTPMQLEMTWPTFDRLRALWAGKVELQAVSLVVLSYFREFDAGTALADAVAAHGGVLGAAVCCSETGGHPEDDWTTCEADRDQLLDRVFGLAMERGLDLDFHVDENRNTVAQGLRHIAEKALQLGFQGRIVCGHCCSLAWQTPEDVAATAALVGQAGITVVSLPMVNEWTQDRCPGRTPRWRGVTALQELASAGVPVALASDNTRDQFYAYGDLDMLEVFSQGCKIGHLDRPYGAWPGAVTTVPAAAMGVNSGRLTVGGPADFVLFRGRCYSELLSRPQFDRVVVRHGKAITDAVPDYRQLDEGVPSLAPSQAPSNCKLGHTDD